MTTVTGTIGIVAAGRGGTAGVIEIEESADEIV
jgi:hypothetical protein